MSIINIAIFWPLENDKVTQLLAQGLTPQQIYKKPKIAKWRGNGEVTVEGLKKTPRTKIRKN